MVSRRLAFKKFGVYLRIAIFLLLLLSLYVMSNATRNSENTGDLYPWLFFINSLCILVLVILIVANIVSLVRQRKKERLGTRLTLRLLIFFIILSVVPGSVVYYFSIQFINSGVDSWFDVRVEEAFNDAIELSRASLDVRMKDHLRKIEIAQKQLEDIPEEAAALTLGSLRREISASEVSLLGSNGRIVASSNEDTSLIVPHSSSENYILKVKNDRPYLGLDPVADKGLHIKILVSINRRDPGSDAWVLSALFPVSDRMNELSERVSDAYDNYNQLVFMRKPLKRSFVYTLSLVLAVSLFSAIWGAFYAARRFVAPVRVLVSGTQAITAGDYSKQLPMVGKDELGDLVMSFNDMTRKIAQVRDEAKRSQQQAEKQRTYLETVLGHLSSGVLTINADYLLRTGNSAAEQILSLELTGLIQERLDAIAERYNYLESFVEVLVRRVTGVQEEWSEQVTFYGPKGQQVLMCRGVPMPGGLTGRNGYVIVFDDITELIQAQRDSAWGEVARRLAHEIKNPLTPIQLSAERLRRKYLKDLEESDGELLERSTRTIIQQVDTMKEMVNAFADYAKAPEIKPEPINIVDFIEEIIDLHTNSEGRTGFLTEFEDELPSISFDPGRLRQVFNNLIKNAVESSKGVVNIRISARPVIKDDSSLLELVVADDGAGLPSDIIGHIFEPYVTTKSKGTGLGLPIVKKIIEEHGGSIRAENSSDADGGGAIITILLPLSRTISE